MRWHGDEGGVPRVRIRPTVRIGSGAWSVRHRSGRCPHSGRQRTASPRHLHLGAPRSPFRANPCPNTQTTSGRWHLRRSPCWIRVWRLLHADIAQQGPVRPILRDRDLSSSQSRDARVSRAGFRPGQSWPAQGAAQQLPESATVAYEFGLGELRLTRPDPVALEDTHPGSPGPGGRLDELPERRFMGPQCIRALEELARPEARSDVSLRQHD
jgi:hypothetical protein